MIVKICGLKNPENIKSIATLAPDYMGFIFYGPSPRFAGNLTVETLTDLPAAVQKTAVFVNEEEENIIDLIEKYHFDAIQLHGNESPGFCANFIGKVKVIKAFGLDNNFNFARLYTYVDKVDFFLFDTKTDLHGGSGKTFDWGVLDGYHLNVPFLLSGGIGLDNLNEVKNIKHPQFFGVDLNSKFETAPGMKDIEKLKKAFDIIKHSLYQ